MPVTESSTLQQCKNCHGFAVTPEGKTCGKCEAGLAFKVAHKRLDADEQRLGVVRAVKNACANLGQRMAYLARKPKRPYGAGGNVGELEVATGELLAKYQKAITVVLAESNDQVDAAKGGKAKK